MLHSPSPWLSACHALKADALTVLLKEPCATGTLVLRIVPSPLLAEVPVLQQNHVPSAPPPFIPYLFGKQCPLGFFAICQLLSQVVLFLWC